MVNLKAENLTVSLGKNQILKGMTVQVSSNEILGIIGPNGSGKTTLLRTMAGLIKPDQGSVLMDGGELQSISASERAKKIAYLPQSTTDHSFTAMEFVLMGRYPHLARFGLEGRSDVNVAKNAMDRTGTAEFTARRLQTLSGGEKQRVSLARVLAQEAKALLLDEPTSSLDMQHQLLTMSTARDEAEKGVAVAVVLHDLSLASKYCDRLVLMKNGRVIAEGKPWDVITRSNLRNVFNVDAAVEADPISGRPSVSLLGATSHYTADQQENLLTVHIICGAGSGRDLMHRLVSAGHTVSACVLGEGDADRETAVRLGIEHVPSPPFSTISLEQDTLHRSLVRKADVTVVCDMAIGPGNLRNLEAASEARKSLLLKRGKAQEWDYSEGKASAVFEELCQRGQLISRDELLETISSII